MQLFAKRLTLYWQRLLRFVFLLLCLRFVLAELFASRTNMWPSFLLVFICLVLAQRSPIYALFAFTMSIFIVNGLERASFLSCKEALCLMFSSIYLGSGFSTHTNYLHYNSTEKSYQHPWILLIVDMLISVIIISLAIQLWKHYEGTGNFVAACEQASYGFGASYYFLTSAFLWLQGLFFFRMLLSLTQEPREVGNPLERWIKPTFIAYGFTLALFCAFQFFYRIPAPLVGYAYYLPCEDISSFGSICVAVFIMFVTQLSASLGTHKAIVWLSVLTLFVLIVASWSRGTWLAASVSFLVFCCLRVSRRWLFAFLGIAAVVLLAINFNARNQSWLRHPYLARIIALARFENPELKSPERMFLYHKAIDMLRLHPIAGTGIGSFYLSSIKYARPEDPNGSIPDFAHDAYLQVAVELGTPTAICLAGLTTMALCVGFFRYKRAHRIAESNTTINVLACTLALAAYIFTQLTANSLNVYATNQFFFWFLMAVLLSGSYKYCWSSEIGFQPS